MRHRNQGRRMSRKTEHRRSLLRNLVTSLIEKERIETTVSKAKETRPLAEWMITLAKQGDLAARRQAAAYLLNPNAVKFLFEELSKRYATRAGGYTRLVHAGWRKGDGADVAVLELVDNEVLQRLSAKRAKKVESRRKAAEEAKAQEPVPPPEEEGGEKK
ncbi:MAG: 50S ribosomal protein L17 [Acidobacteriota bacterium]|nr:50S ribosomal protein L17 [Acidobacteriota bacterium]